MKVGIIGLGLVGLAHAVCLAHKGFKVNGVDLNERRIHLINNGCSPFKEPFLEDMLKETINKTLHVSKEYEGLKDVNLVFITVDTPTREDGTQDISNLEKAIKNLAAIWDKNREYRVIAVKSTVLPGTTRRIANFFSDLVGEKNFKNFGFVANPEFLREGNAVQDIFYPYRVVIGGINDESSKRTKDLWLRFYKIVGRVPPIFTMGLEEAELVKYVSNTFLAMKVSFANTIAYLCEKLPGCDVQKVIEATSYDPRIGREYLRPGPGYGGPCLPKDVQAFIKFLRDLNVKSPLIEGVYETNEIQQQRIIEILTKEIGNLKGKKIAILGLSFKAGTDDIRDSVSIKVIEKLLKLGSSVKVHDPLAMENAKLILGNSVEYCNTIKEAVSNVNGIVVLTEWKDYEEIDPNLINRDTIIVDFRRILRVEEFNKAGLKTHVIGLGSPLNYEVSKEHKLIME